MKIAIIGSGGVGGYFGGRLCAAGANVHFVARGTHLDALKNKGLEVKSDLGNFHLRDISCTDNTETIGTVDIVLLTVKLWSTEEAVKSIAPLIAKHTAVISLQNGVVAIDTLTPIVGEEHVVGGVSKIAALIEEPGLIRHNGAMAALEIGELNGESSERTEKFSNACIKANIDITVSKDIHTAIWSKFVLLTTMSGMTSLTRLPIGPLREDKDTRQLMKQIMGEVVQIGLQKGAKFPSDIVDKMLNGIGKMPETMVASMCGDLRRHNKLELPWFAGTVCKLGSELGIDTPANQFVYSALKLHANGKHPMLQQ